MVKTITVDTLTAIQENEYMADKKKPGHDQWKDYGQSIFTFVNDLMKLGFEIIYILGEPGTGKSSGMRTLPHDSNVWFNADNKNPIWTGGKEEYGKKTNPRAPFHMIPTTYQEMLDHIKAGLDKGIFENERYAFVLGHIEAYKTGIETKERLKVLGKLASKMQLEGKAETVLYSRVEMEGGKRDYILETQSSGYNTARSPMDLFEGKISNDYNLVIEKLSSY